jgi:antirestriction protein ArdC
MSKTDTARADVHTRVTERIIEDLSKGVRPGLKPWTAGNAEGRITPPFRHNGTPYKGVNVQLLWGEARARGHPPLDDLQAGCRTRRPGT